MQDVLHKYSSLPCEIEKECPPVLHFSLAESRLAHAQFEVKELTLIHRYSEASAKLLARPSLTGNGRA